MAFYFLDAVCAKCDFEGVGLKWTPKEESPVHIYYNILSNTGQRGMYEKIAKYFISPIYNVFFGEEPPCVFERDKASLHDITDLFSNFHITYIRVFGAYKYLHVLPTFVTDKIVLQEVV